MEELQTTELERIKTLLNAAFHGGAWHGPFGFRKPQRYQTKNGWHSPKKYSYDCRIGLSYYDLEDFCIEKIQGDVEFEIKTEKQNWGNIIEVDEFEWETLQMELTLSHDELMSALEEKDDSFLTEIVPGAEYDFYTLLHGIIHHDLYHNGQIGILKKSAPKTSKFDDEDEFRTTSYFENEY